MKIVNTLYKTFRHTFQGDRKECWARHINKLEAEVLDPNSFEPKQVYYALRKTLRGEAITAIESLEAGTDVPIWNQCVPIWFTHLE